MTELLPSRRRAEEFARALEGQAPAGEPRLQRLLSTVSTLAAVPVVEPRREFRDSLRQRLVETAAVDLPAQARAHAAAVDTAAAPAPVRPTHARHAALTESPLAARRRRRLVAVATGLVLVGAGGGVAAASEQALPGDVLYPVKRTLESAQVTLAQGYDSEGRALLERASTRLQEAQDLGGDGDYSAAEVGVIEATLHDFGADASDGGRHLLDSYALTRDRGDLRALRDFTARSHQVLNDLTGALPAASRPAVVAADETVVALDHMAVRACPECSDQPPLSLPTDPVSLPTLGGQASPDPRAHEPRGSGAEDAGAAAADRPDTDTPDKPRTNVGDTAPPRLPDLDLTPRDAPSAEPSDAPSSGDDLDSGGTRDRAPLLGLDDVLGSPSPEPTKQQPRTTELPGVDGLTDPLRPLLDGDVLDDML
jgi:Domain of unknown function (DUF5667)